MVMLVMKADDDHGSDNDDYMTRMSSGVPVGPLQQHGGCFLFLDYYFLFKKIPCFSLYAIFILYGNNE